MFVHKHITVFLHRTREELLYFAPLVGQRILLLRHTRLVELTDVCYVKCGSRYCKRLVCVLFTFILLSPSTNTCILSFIPCRLTPHFRNAVELPPREKETTRPSSNSTRVIVLVCNLVPLLCW